MEMKHSIMVISWTMKLNLLMIKLLKNITANLVSYLLEVDVKNVTESGSKTGTLMKKTQFAKR